MGKQVVKPSPIITGRGCDKEGRQIFSVASRTTADASYRVTRHEHALSCTCMAGQNGKVCCHRVAVHDLLVAERDAQALRIQAASARPAAAPLYRNNKPFSIWAD